MEFKTNDNVTLHYSDTGEKDKPVLLGIPGIGGSSQMWRDLINLFKKDYRFIMLDPRNQGKSERTYRGQRISRHAADLEELLVKLDLHDVVAIGNSMGAANIWAYLSIYGKGRLKAMVDLDQSPKMIADKNWKYGFKDLNWDNYPEMLKLDFGKAFYHHIDDEMFEAAKKEYQEFPYDPEENYSCLVEHAEQDWRDVVMDMPVPLLVIAGAKSPYFNPDFIKAVKFLNDQVETALIPECGHLPQAEQPEKTHEIIADFLKNLKIW
jgi:pimeloyl-ACP methyl ester carboxylesterase